MASLKALKIRIGSVKSTQKITKALKMVAAAKLRRAQQGAESGRPYASRLTDVVSSLASRVTVGPQSPRLIAGTGADQRHLIVVATADRGLAGAFSSNVVRAVRRKADDLAEQGKTVFFYIVGRKGRPVLQRVFPKSIIAQFDTTEMKAPARPRSPVTTTFRWTSSLPVPVSSRGLCGPGVTFDASEATIAAMRSE